MFGRIGMGELLLILGIVLIVFGPAKLPALAKSMGQAVAEFRKVQEKSQRNGTRWKAKPSLRLKRQKLRKKLPTDQRSCEQEALA